MIVRFGISLDGMQPSIPATAVGEVSLGPAGLLGVLENQLGLPSGGTSAAEEIAACRACIDELADEEAFYRGSYSVDPIGVVRALLDWRQPGTSTGGKAHSRRVSGRVCRTWPGLKHLPRTPYRCAAGSAFSVL